MKKFGSRLKEAHFAGDARAAILPGKAAQGNRQISPSGGRSSGFRRVALAGLASTRFMASLPKVVMPLLAMTTLGATTHLAQADGTKVGSWNVPFDDGWYTFGWTSGSAPHKSTHGTRSWSGTDTTFTGQGGWFSTAWTGAGGNWIPDISRGGSSAGPLSSMVENYNVQWNGTGVIIPNGSKYTFGLKFNLADAPGWKNYDLTSSYEAYIVTHTNHTTKHGRFMGTVYPPGDPVGYDCYEWKVDFGEFKQLYAWRRENTWSGPVNVQAILKFWSDKSGTSLNMKTWYMSTGMSIAAETFDSSGAFRLENIRIPALTTLLPLPKPTPKPASGTQR